MDLSKIKPAKGAVRRKKRIARGEGAGTGDTATRGHKGQKSRSGYSRKSGFEGGQMPLARRLPKYGFINRNRVAYQPINLSTLQALAEGKGLETIDFSTLIAHGLVSKNEKVKILGKGELKAKINVSAHAFSAAAAQAIEAMGGTVNRI